MGVDPNANLKCKLQKTLFQKTSLPTLELFMSYCYNSQILDVTLTAIRHEYAHIYFTLTSGIEHYLKCIQEVQVG